MFKVNNGDILAMQRDFAVALVKFSSGALNSSVAEQISEQIIPKLDFNNSSLAHKGLNWYAKEVLSKLDMSVYS